MYYIMTLNNGQPVVLLYEDGFVYMYLISSGRIYNKGVLFSNILSCFEVFGTYIYFIDNNHTHKLYKLEGNKFSEMLSLYVDTSTIVKPVYYNNCVNLFYTQTYNKTANCFLYCSSALLPYRNTQILQVNENLIDFTFFIKDNHPKQSLFLLLTYPDDKYEMYSLDTNLVPTRIEFTDATYRHLIGLKDKEIAKLEEARDNIAYQYNNLTDYVTELQNELRKYRYNCLIDFF